MKFKNSLRFKYGTLKRGEPCLWRSHKVIYMGSYQECEGSGWIHMLHLQETFVWHGLLRIEDSILQCQDKSEITCHHQYETLEGQMKLC